MVFAQSHVLIRANGYFGSGSTQSDYWSSGLRIARAEGVDLPITDAGLVALLETISGPYATFHALATTWAGTACFLNALSAAAIGTDGHYTSQEQKTTWRNYPSVVQGSGTGVHPWSTAMVCSLRTAKQRGYASNGRAYWPATSVVLASASGRRNNADVLTTLGGWKTLIDAINSAASGLGPGARVSVMSAVGSGHTAPVTSLRMDGRLDQQERRENKIPSEWSTVSIAGS